MQFRDFVEISFGNLFRMKLRALLTISGVVIAIAAFVSMLSFGAGMQESIADEFNQLGLFNTMYVYEKRADDNNEQDQNENEENDQVEAAKPDSASLVIKPLNDSTIALLSEIPGVRLVYPFDNFSVTIDYEDSSYQNDAQSLTVSATKTPMFAQLSAGRFFLTDSSHEAVVTTAFLEEVGVDLDSAEQVIGKMIAISVSVSSLDSAVARVIKDEASSIGALIREVKFDSIRIPEYRNKILRNELSGALQSFMDGLMNDREILTDSVVIVGVLKEKRGRSRVESLLLPTELGRKFSSSGFSTDPADLFQGLSSGTLFQTEDESGPKEYSRLTIDLEPMVQYSVVSDSVKALGYRSFSYAEEFDEIKQVFFYFNMVLGIVGFVAMITAALGIVNTMVMSIIERRKEIGILKSLGADEREIKLLFLVESGVIGSVGAITGIVVGWLITRLASFIAQQFMASKGIDQIDMFSMPIWLILIAFGFGLVVSLIAGYFPSARASRVDPVQALRNE